MGFAFALAVIAGLSVANLYYVQSLLPAIAQQLGLSASTVLLAPMVIQIGLALSLLLVLPIGDGLERRKLLVKAALGTAIASAAIAFLPDFRMLLIAWFVLGLFALVPYLLPAYASGLVADDVRGKTLGVILSGQFSGILLSRSFSGVVGEQFGWRSVFVFSALTMAVIAVWMHKRLPFEKKPEPISYFSLQASQLRLLRSYPDLRRACISQSLQFGTFMGVWSALAFHLSESPWRMGPALIGAFGLVGIVSIAAAPSIGRLVDQVGAARIVIFSTLCSLLGVVLLALFSTSLVGIAFGLVFLDLGVQGSYVANQTRVFSLNPAARSRMACLLFFSAYAGAAFSSAMVAYFWSGWGWQGVTAIGIVLVLLALISQYRTKRHSAAY
jgi:predicted MFS family arabinose efflux permease